VSDLEEMAKRKTVGEGEAYSRLAVARRRVAVSMKRKSRSSARPRHRGQGAVVMRTTLRAWTTRVRGGAAMLVGKVKIKMVGSCRMGSIASIAKRDEKTYQR